MGKMKKYLYETHMHTSESSACATITGAEQVRIYKKLGYSGIIVTDHFYNGNTSISRRLPWREWVEGFARGYENAKKEGDRIGLTVLFGWEESFSGNDFLVYGLDKEWLINHPQILSWSLEEHYKYIKKDGGFLVHAHPFREASYIPRIRLFPDITDGVEVINASHEDLGFDSRAHKYAILHKKYQIAGSDSHHHHSRRGGILLDHELEDIKDFISSVKNESNIDLVKDVEKQGRTFQGYLRKNIKSN